MSRLGLVALAVLALTPRALAGQVNRTKVTWTVEFRTTGAMVAARPGRTREQSGSTEESAPSQVGNDSSAEGP